MTTVEPVAPTMPARLRALYDVSPDEMRVTFKARQLGAAVFFLLFLSLWSAGCAFVAHEAFEKRDVFSILFGTPFWIGWVFVAGMLIASLTRRQELLLDGQGLAYDDRAIIRLKQRRVPRDELRGFAVRYEDNDDSESTPQLGLEIRTAGQPLFVFAGLPEAELEWFAYQLSQLVDAMPQPAGTVREETPAIDEPAADAPCRQPLVPAREAVEPPSDCSWELDRKFAVLSFVQAGRWSWGGVLTILCVTAFWNAIVGVFVGGLLGVWPMAAVGRGEWWFLFFFLIPFEVIGLALFGALVVMMLEPVRKRIWTLEARHIEHRWQWFGIGRTWVYPVEGLVRVDVVREEDEARQRRRGKKIRATNASWGDAVTPFSLVLVAPGNRELCEIDGLTEGEARFIGDAILRQRPEWFRS
ncbi:MAG: hypothetical protein DWQ37_11535 [Planctomycetota bacterium]|nr:MAG: hypothetical protein DWQ37_11535 [Planctomycetota bacterium]